ncbi:protein KAKU4-like isoform X2 [Papaver somniferum]|uniref:protein KAKU4-like isoform X2 n=1 Tax=Papaver somniferum TaxID=3469 RepID=UPI000E70536C|nr:protein KAKU4-like isoform X2 [Papaver somniferum]
MASFFRVRRNSDNESVGGKMSRGRRIVNYSPYARPSPAPAASSSSQSTEITKNGWFSGFVVPASRMIANGAGKIVSTVFGSQDSHSSSDNDSDDDDDEDIDESGSDDNNDHISQRSDGINQNTIESHRTKFLERQPLAVAQRSESKLQIERLLMQETFSRDECNRLTKIIQSRVVECHASREGGNASLGAAQFGEEGRKSNSYMGYGVDSLSSGPLALHYAAIMESKKWLEEKKSESSPKLENSPLALTASPSNKYIDVTEGEVGSPVLMAKTYMRSRPPWASPSSSHVGFRTPSPIRIPLVKEETPISDRSVFSSKFARRSPLANNSQEILAELRRVRLKSEEAMLLSDSSIHIQPSASELGHKDGRTASRDGEHSKVEPTTKSIDSAAMMMENDGLAIETTSSVPAVILSNKNQDLEDPRFKESVEETARVNNTSEVEYRDGSIRHLKKILMLKLSQKREQERKGWKQGL